MKKRTRPVPLKVLDYTPSIDIKLQLELKFQHDRSKLIEMKNSLENITTIFQVGN